MNTSYGWHIFRTVNWVDGRQKDFSEVKQEIEQRLRPLKERELLDSIIENSKIKYAVVIDSSLVNTITLDVNKRNNNNPILDNVVLSSSDPDLRFTVRQLLQIYD